MDFTQLFQGKKPVIGMVHLKALPGAPGYNGSMEEIYTAACEDLCALEQGGVDGAIVENFGDVPYNTNSGEITLTAMAVLAQRLRAQTSMPLGLNVQYNNTAAEWNIAYCTGYDFIRVEAFVENRTGVHGITYAAAPALLRQKGLYPANSLIFADINTKHTFPLTPQPLDFSVHEAKEAGADALIVTGLLTGQNPTVDEVAKFKKLAATHPVLLGSGVNTRNAASFFEVADGAIIGSSLKQDGNVWKNISAARVREFMFAIGR